MAFFLTLSIIRGIFTPPAQPHHLVVNFPFYSYMIAHLGHFCNSFFKLYWQYLPQLAPHHDPLRDAARVRNSLNPAKTQ